MSQAGLARISVSNIPPVVPISFVTNSGTATAAGNILNVLGTTQVASGIPVETTAPGASNTIDVIIQISSTQASSALANAGLSSYNSSQFGVDANGYVSLSSNYTNVNHAASPYTVLASDNYISVDCSAGAVTLKFPNAPTAKRTWVVKDRTGSASTNNISITTVGGAVTIDGQTTYTINGNYVSVSLLANATPTYEVY